MIFFPRLVTTTQLKNAFKFKPQRRLTKAASRKPNLQFFTTLTNTYGYRKPLKVKIVGGFPMKYPCLKDY